jgi:hypothetical protein
MKLAHAFRWVSGPSLDGCHFLADRWDGKGWMEDHAESWIGEVVEGRPRVIKGQVGWLTGLWRSPSGRVFASEGGSLRTGVHVLEPGAPGSELKLFPLPCLCAGVWGLSDRLVFTWGHRADRRAEGMFRWDGSQWREMPSPGRVVAMHGVHPELIYAVGAEGLIARWDGGSWHNVPSFLEWTLNAVHVVGPDEMYASGGGGMLEGTQYGWSLAVSHEGMLTDVAKHRDVVYLAGENDGLLKRVGDRLEEVDPTLKGNSLDVRGRLVVGTATTLADSDDGKQFRKVSIEAFAQLVAGVRRMW